MKCNPIFSSVLVLISVCFVNLCYTQTATVKGNVTIAETNIPLSGTIISLEPASTQTMSSSGSFIFSNLMPGKYTIRANSIGYKEFETQINLTENDTLALHIKLTENISILDDVVIMSKGNTGKHTIPGAVTYISPKELQQFNYTDINRVLGTVPGVNIQQEDGFGLRPNIGLRGTGVERSSKISVMEDGVLIAPAPYVAPAAYYFPTIGRIHAMEILKGSSQIKYGPYTTGGAINLISTPIPNQFSGKINLLAGSYGNKNLHATVGNSHEQVAYMVESFQYSSDGFKQLPNGDNTGFTKSDYLAKLKVNAKPSARIYQSATFKVGRATEQSNETYLGLSLEDFETNSFQRYAASQVDQMNTEQNQYSISHFLEFPNLMTIRTTAYRTEFSRNWYKLDRVKNNAGERISIANVLHDPVSYSNAYEIIKGETSTNSDALEVKANNREYYAQGIQSEVNHSFLTNEVDHQVSIGFRYHKDEIDRYQWVDKYSMNTGEMLKSIAGTPGTESNRVENATAIASYLQYQLAYKQWTLHPGLRYEHIKIARDDFGKEDPTRSGENLNQRDNSVSIFIPGIALDYKINKSLHSFLGVHKGFSPPGSKEDTNSEESINYEVGTRYQSNRLTGEIVAFFNDYKNLLGSDLNAVGGQGSGQLFNGGSAETKGLEILATYQLLSSNSASINLPFTVSYTYTDAQFTTDFESENDAWGNVSTGDNLPYLANHQLAGVLGVEHQSFGININARYTSPMRILPGQQNFDNVNSISHNFIADCSANYTIHKNINLFGNVNNIANASYEVARRPAGMRPNMPRNIMAGIRANF